MLTLCVLVSPRTSHAWRAWEDQTGGLHPSSWMKRDEQIDEFRLQSLLNAVGGKFPFVCEIARKKKKKEAMR